MQKGFTKKDPPKPLGTRVSCKTGTGLGGQGQDDYRVIHIHCMPSKRSDHLPSYVIGENGG